jgi:hypothetical protein
LGGGSFSTGTIGELWAKAFAMSIAPATAMASVLTNAIMAFSPWRHGGGTDRRLALFGSPIRFDYPKVKT